MFIKYKRVFLVLLLMLIILLAACSSADESSEQGESNESDTLADTLNLAIGAQPPILDPHLSATLVTRDIVKQVYETLITVDADYNPVPMLAESVEESEDGKTYTFQLREGVTFHNGEEMTSEDVVASMTRWVESNTTAQVFLKGAEFKADGDYKVILEVANPSVFVLSTLGATTQIAAIMPKEIIESAPKSGITEYIGTGPFQFEEWSQDQYIHISKYDDYQSLESESEGLSGKKEVFMQDVYFHFVPDISTQLTGLQTGQYDLLLEAPFDNYEMLLNDPDIETTINDYGPFAIIFNKNAGIFTDVTMRQGVNTGINFTEILQTSFVHEDIYELDSSYVSTQNETWYSDAGDDYYNLNDPAKAKELFNEAGYNGEEIKILGTRDYPHIYNAGVVLQQQLENLGLNASLEIYDWPTALSTRNNEPDNWDIFISGDQFFVTPIENYVYTHDIYRDKNDSTVTEYIEDIKNADTIEEAQEMWHELQAYSWENPHLIKVGNADKVSAFRSQVKDYKYLDGPILWNTKVEK